MSCFDEVNCDDPIEKSKHLLHEIELMDYTIKELQAMKDGQRTFEELDPCVYIDSFLMHARTLYESLWKAKSSAHPDDIRAKDLAEDYKLPAKSDFLNKWVVEHINKRLAHLSDRRIIYDLTDPDWHLGEIYKLLQSQLLKFYDCILDENICPDLKRLKEQALEEARQKQRENKPVLDPSLTGITNRTSDPGRSVIIRGTQQ